MKSFIFALTLLLFGRASAHAATEFPRTSFWRSKFEACMCEVEAPLILYHGRAYLYNRAHASLRDLGSYATKDNVSRMTRFKQVAVDLEFTIQDDKTLSVRASQVIPEMGLALLLEKDSKHWIFQPETDRRIIRNALLLIMQPSRLGSRWPVR